MNDLIIPMWDIDLPPGVVSYRGQIYLREPPSGYNCGTPPADAEEPAKAVKLYPLRKDLLWKTIIEDLPEDFLQFFFRPTSHSRTRNWRKNLIKANRKE